MNSCRVIVATHKAAKMPKNGLYLPIHVGHAISSVEHRYQPDDEGDNISHLNPSYCELTAHYWAWKNTSFDAYGLSHYRRYFIGSAVGPNDKGVLSGPEALTLLEQYDVVLPRKRNYFVETVHSHYAHGHYESDLDALRRTIQHIYPEYLKAYDETLRSRSLSLYNMFLMRNAAFQNYSEWLFSILADLETRIDISERNPYQQRVFGYLGERLINVWALKNVENLRIGYRRIINTDGENLAIKAIGLLRRKFGLTAEKKAR